MQDRFKLRYFYNGKIYDVFAVDFMNKTAQLVSLDRKEILFKGIDIAKLIQCTGIKDKNEKIIFEGDIVYKKGSVNCNKEKLLSTILWSSDSAAFMLSDENGLHQMPRNSNNIEILGNIYENPELLK